MPFCQRQQQWTVPTSRIECVLFYFNDHNPNPKKKKNEAAELYRPGVLNPFLRGTSLNIIDSSKLYITRKYFYMLPPP